MPEENLRLLTAKELADILSTSVRSVWRYRASGKLPQPMMVGSSCRWRQSDIHQWLNLDCPDMKTFKAIIQTEDK